MKRCILCNSNLHKLFSIKNMPATAQDIPSLEELEVDKPIDLGVCECKACGLIQLDTEPVHYYKDVIRASSISSTMRDLRLGQYKHFVETYGLSGGSIVELGCGGGEFLALWDGLDVKAYGIEHSLKLVEKAKALGLRVERDFPESEEHEIKNAPFDAFCSFNFLEHQPNPLIYLRAAAHNIVEGGYGLITVPSFEYILEKKSYYEIIADHIAYYSFESLELAVRLAGFEVIEKELINRDTISLIIKKRIKRDVSVLENERKFIEDDVKGLIKASVAAGKKVAVWGAGHQGFTLCATMGLGNYISYIIDSAKFKQGLYAPASHIAIVSPEYAYKNPVDVIIIVAPGYSEEIARIIGDNFDKEVEIYTLMSDRLTKL